MKARSSSLSRIETSLIFAHFQNKKPKFYIKTKEVRCFIERTDYIVKDMFVVLKKEQENLKENEIINVYFLYKKVKVFFRSVLEKKDGLFFNIPDRFYLKKKKKTTSVFPSLSLYHQNLLLSTFLSAGFNKKSSLSPVLSKNEVQKIFTRSTNLGHNLIFLLNELKRYIPKKENLYCHLSIINDFLLKKECGKLKEKNLYILSDSNVILLFSSIKFAKQFACSLNKCQELSAKISFKNRNILCTVQYDFFSPFLKGEDVCDYGFLGLKISNIQEEDKRYLYEGIFTNMYGEYCEKNI